MTLLKLAAVVVLALPVGIGPDSECRKSAEPPPKAETPKPDAFAANVRPVLAAKCAPCHEPGGKMYAKLPFDRPGTIADHSQAILRRLKGEDREAVETWLASLRPKE